MTADELSERIGALAALAMILAVIIAWIFFFS